MRHRIRGRYYDVVKVRRIDAEGALGECDPPEKKNKQICILRTLKGKELLRILIHEALHAGLWDITEETVDELSTDLANLIFKEMTWETQ
jgi:hypothetical protein